MLRRFLALAFLLALCAPFAACQENEYKTSQEVESTTETTPTDSSPGEMVVE